MVVLFAVTAFSGAALLFLVEPMIAKLVLPSYGGTPMVWNTATLFFQVMLLAGYLYVHVTTTRLGPRRQPLLHAPVLLLPLLALPLALPQQSAPPEDSSPAVWLLRTMVLAVGLPFAVLATTGTLLQRWFSWLGHARSQDPYFLYAASNAGSFVGLLGYPFVVEPTATLVQQRMWWSAAYVVFLGLFAGCGAVVLVRGRAVGGRAAAHLREVLTVRRRLWWVFLAFLPSSLMLGVTTHITTDVAAVPLLWVLPLAIYLATFVVAFGRGRRTVPRGLLLAAAGLGLASLVSALVPGLLPLGPALVLHLGALAVIALAAHTVLAADRPDPSRLTEYFVLVAVGGAMGGLLNGLLAPVVLEGPLEYPIVLALVPLVGLGWLAPGASPLDRGPDAVRRALLLLSPVLLALVGLLVLAAGYGWPGAALLVVGLAGAGTVLAGRPAVLATLLVAVVALSPLLRPAVVQERTFFGTYRVLASADHHRLLHGTTVHGLQYRDGRSGQPTSYYARSGPLGDVFTVLSRQDSPARIGAVGLGTGTVAAYGESGQRMRFYEIDPAMEEIARDGDLFTFLEASSADVDVVLGDGRLALEEEPDGAFDLLVLDAFSSDAIPVHLLTREAFQTYDRVTDDGGLIAVHISNRHFSLDPVVLAAAREIGLAAVVRLGGERTDGGLPARWVVLSRDPAALESFTALDGWETLAGEERLWTDDHSSVVGVLRW